jgi:hypothetical protein
MVSRLVSMSVQPRPGTRSMRISTSMRPHGKKSWRRRVSSTVLDASAATLQPRVQRPAPHRAAAPLKHPSMSLGRRPSSCLRTRSRFAAIHQPVAFECAPATRYCAPRVDSRRVGCVSWRHVGSNANRFMRAFGVGWMTTARVLPHRRSHWPPRFSADGTTGFGFATCCATLRTARSGYALNLRRSVCL